MPFTRVSLRSGKSREYLRALADSLDRALVQTFEVPPGDRFVVVHQHGPEELLFDKHYGGGPRSDDFILFHVTTGRARSSEVKRAFYNRLVRELGESPGVRQEDVMIVIANSDIEDWSFGCGRPAANPSESAGRGQ